MKPCGGAQGDQHWHHPAELTPWVCWCVPRKQVAQTAPPLNLRATPELTAPQLRGLRAVVRQAWEAGARRSEEEGRRQSEKRRAMHTGGRKAVGGEVSPGYRVRATQRRWEQTPPGRVRWRLLAALRKPISVLTEASFERVMYAVHLESAWSFQDMVHFGRRVTCYCLAILVYLKIIFVTMCSLM